MPTKKPTPEARWPAAVAIVAVLFLLTLLPGRIRIFPFWVPYAIGLVALVPMLGVALSGASTLWVRIERVAMRLFFLLTGTATLANLTNLVSVMVSRPAEVSGMQLLATSVAVWVTNVLIFALLYWQVDRGGPEARASSVRRQPDWLFPHDAAPAEVVPPGWRPTFVDYLFLGYSTATAFSATDAPPLTARAKLLMMLQSTISLVNLAVVAARAINILGS
jgi:hypothetical protein